MARGPSPLLLVQIREPKSRTELISALRAVKNDVVGNEQKKEMWIGLGILEPLARLLTTDESSTNRSGKQHYDYNTGLQPLGEEEAIRLHAVSIVGSLAHGGPSFLGPIAAAATIPALFALICPVKNHPQVVLATLRTLKNMVDSAMLLPSSSGLSLNLFAEHLFSKNNISSLCMLISQNSAKYIVQGQISLAASLISRLCREERQQMWLTKHGVLDALAARLASAVVAGGCVVPGAEIIARREGLEADFPPPAPSGIDMPSILEAITIIIASSEYRACRLLYSPAILAVLPPTQFSEFEVNASTRAAWNAYNASGLAARQSQLNAIDSLLPHMPLQHVKSASTHAFPPLGSSGSRENLAQLTGVGLRKGSPTPKSPWVEASSAQSSGLIRDDMEEEVESPLIAWLFYLLRSSTGLECLMAASLLTLLYKAGLTNQSRETALGLLVVPILAQLLDEESNSEKSQPRDALDRVEDLTKKWTIEEVTPAVLASLVTDSEYLQKAAHDAKFITRLSKMIKVAYDPVTETSQSHLWSPIPRNGSNPEGVETTSMSRLGPPGASPLLVHKLKVRESVLKAIAALATLKDEYRKLFAENGVVPYVVESLRPHPKKPTPKPTDDSEKPNTSQEDESGQTEYGTNPTSVLMAACGAVRALSRSTFLLRTTLVDDGVAIPLYRLLQHTDAEVQIDATAAVCNLVLDFSPMRETIAKAGVLKVLCEHAHSMNAKLRLNALWALKHLVLAAGNDVKKSCLEELGQGWLVQLICDDTEDDALLSSKIKWEPFDKPELDFEGDETMGITYPDARFDSKAADVSGLIGRISNDSGIIDNHPATQLSASRSRYTFRASARLAELRDAELNPVRRARKDDVAVQEQGLDFIRNLIGGGHHESGSSTPEIINYLFDTLGQDRVFGILDSKLQHKVVKRRDKRAGSGGEARVIPASPEILAAVGWILVHMAASVPQHRQLIIAQTDMLRHLVPLFNHHSKDVRMSLCWLCTNLTWMDDEADHTSCAQRSYELKKLGFLSKLESLELDPELDIRERAKTAIWQMKQGY